MIYEVYLAGPISGLSYGDATNWRDAVAHDLRLCGLVGLSPMRAKLPFQNCGDLSAWDYPDEGPLSGEAMFKRDLSDVRRASVVLANFMGATEKSLGTIYELGFARALDVPCVVAMEPDNPHRHIFIKHGVDLVCPTLPAAVHWITDVLHVPDRSTNGG